MELKRLCSYVMDDGDAPYPLIELILEIHADPNLAFISKWFTRAVSTNVPIALATCNAMWYFISVPRKVLKDQFDASIEPDEPQQIDMDQNQDDLYDEDQFYRESEAIPPAPKLHRELATSDMPTSLSEPSSSVNPPLRSRDSNQLEGMLLLCLVFSILTKFMLYELTK